jgi:phage repressor protein C with HTH and peptisase S24 domain
MSIGIIIRQRRENLGMTQEQVAGMCDMTKPYLSGIETGKANPPSDAILKKLEKALKFQPGELLHMAHLVRTPADVREQFELRGAQVEKLRGVLRRVLGDPESAARLRSQAGDIDVDSLADHSADRPVRISAGNIVPVINRVSAGYPRHFTDLDYPPSVADEYIRCPDLHDPQAFAARVFGDSMEPKYHEGDVVVFSPNTALHNGQDCFVRFDEDNGTTFKRVYQDDENTIRLQPLNSKYAAEVYPREKITGLWPAVYRMERLGGGTKD